MTAVFFRFIMRATEPVNIGSLHWSETMTPQDPSPKLATLLTPRELQHMKKLYPTLEEASEATGYDFASLRARSIRLNVRWAQERRNLS